MKKLVKIGLILVILFSLTGYVGQATAQIYIYNIDIYDMRDGQIKIRWDTKEPTMARVYLGEDANDLDRYIYYQNYDSQHIINVHGLQKNFTYYFKIVAINRNGQIVETFLQTFSTKSMVDSIVPEFKEAKVIQATSDAVLISWTTNEDTKADIYYGTKLYDLDRRAGAGGFDKYHEIALYDLDYGYTYSVKIIAEDRSRNKKIRFLFFKAGPAYSVGKDVALKIYNIEPQSFDSELINPYEVILKWKTNLASKSRIRWGLETGRYDKHIDVNTEKRRLEHNVELTGLEPNTTYYYQIEVFDSLYRKGKKSREMSFTTSVYSSPAGLVMGEQTASEYLDSDNDKLSDAYEFSIGTNPNNADSDGDGYDDGNEMRHGWDPNVAGSTQDTRLQASNYYMPKRPYEYRLQKDREIRAYVNSRMGAVRVSNKNWRILSDAYIYGHYPAEAIVQAIRFGGKTVHPNIAWSAWKNSGQYGEYINK